MGNYFDKDCKLVPLNIFVRHIFYFLPDAKFKFYFEPLAFTDIIDMSDTFGQTLLDLVFYCARSICLLHSQRKANSGKWPGDMTVKTKNCETHYRGEGLLFLAVL